MFNDLHPLTISLIYTLSRRHYFFTYLVCLIFHVRKCDLFNDLHPLTISLIYTLSRRHYLFTYLVCSTFHYLKSLTLSGYSFPLLQELTFTNNNLILVICYDVFRQRRNNSTNFQSFETLNLLNGENKLMEI